MRGHVSGYMEGDDWSRLHLPEADKCLCLRACLQHREQLQDPAPHLRRAIPLVLDMPRAGPSRALRFQTLGGGVSSPQMGSAW